MQISITTKDVCCVVNQCYAHIRKLSLDLLSSEYPNGVKFPTRIPNYMFLKTVYSDTIRQIYGYCHLLLMSRKPCPTMHHQRHDARDDDSVHEPEIHLLYAITERWRNLKNITAVVALLVKYTAFNILNAPNSLKTAVLTSMIAIASILTSFNIRLTRC